jgi:hypothetical protein
MTEDSSSLVYSDENTEGLSCRLSDQAFALSDALASPLGVTQPTTARSVLGNLMEAARELVRSFDRLDAFLSDELKDRKLTDAHGLDPTVTVMNAQGALVDAAASAEAMIAALGDAHDLMGAIKAVPSAKSSERSARSERSAQHSAGETGPGAAAPRAAATDFPAGVGDVLQAGGNGQPGAPLRQTWTASRPMPKAP